MLFKKGNYFNSILFKKQSINSLELYRYSLFFRNYVENFVEDALKPGIKLELLIFSGFQFNDLQCLKLELSEALLETMISYRFNGAGYILIKPKVLDEDLSKSVNDELPDEFQYLDYKQIKDDRSGDCLEYLQDDGNFIVIHKSKIIIHGNFDYILGVHAPVYTQSLLLDICLLEQIYVEIEKRIKQYNFIFYKDEQPVELMQALQDTKSQINTFSTKNKGLFSTFFQNNDNVNTNLGSIGFELDRLLERLKGSLGNDGIFYSANSEASLEIVRYDFLFLKEAFELVKSKIGADTKELLTRSFNEQVKGLGSDGKGDRANYIDFLHTVKNLLQLQ